MTGRIASDVTTPAQAHRVIQVHFTKPEFEALLTERAAQIVGLDSLGVDAGLRAWQDLEGGAWNVRVEFDVPAATPAPFPRFDAETTGLKGHDPVAAPSAPPPRSDDRMPFWFEFPVGEAPHYSLAAGKWGHGRCESEAYVDACVRSEGDVGTLNRTSRRAQLSRPLEVLPIFYEFDVPGFGMTFIGAGHTEREAWKQARAAWCAIPAGSARTCVGTSRNSIQPGPAPSAAPKVQP